MPWEDLAPAGSADTDYEWELFNLRADFSQAKDLAPSNPAKLAEMKALFDREAERNHVFPLDDRFAFRSEEHTSELQSLMRISYAVFCLKTKNTYQSPNTQ